MRNNLALVAIIIKISLGAFFGIKDFDKLSQEVVQKLILKLAEIDYAGEALAYTAHWSFHKLPKEFRVITCQACRQRHCGR
jgi:hypothetical protein